MEIRFFFQYSGQVVQLPVNPEDFEQSRDGNNKNETLVEAGEITIINKPKLGEFSIESFFPVNSAPPYVLTKGSFKGPQFYIDFFEKIRDSKEPCRLVISGLDVNTLVTIEDFKYKNTWGTEDVEYQLKCLEYKEIKVATVQLKQPTTETAKPVAVEKPANTTNKDNTQFSIGDTVIVNGLYRYDSYGSKPHGNFNNFTGKISHIVSNPKSGQLYPYHITTMSGGWRGWVKKDQMKHA